MRRVMTASFGQLEAGEMGTEAVVQMQELAPLQHAPLPVN
jgi:hypothetical protein